MKKEHIRQLVNLSIYPVLLMILGLVLAINPDSTTALVTRLLAWGLLICGGVKILVILLDRDDSDLGGWLWAVGFLAAGLFLLRNPLLLAKAVGLVAGLLMAGEGIRNIRKALGRKTAGVSYLAGLILGVATLAAGCVLVLAPLTVSRLAVSVCGIVLIAVGLVNLLSRIRGFRLLGEPKNSHIIDADE